MADQYTVTVRLQGQNQLTPAVGQATQSLRGLNQEAAKTSQVFGQVKTVMAGMFAGVAIAGAARFTEELYASGMAAQRAETMYRSYGVQIGNTDRLLERLRGTTRGIISDTELMNASSDLLSMGLAKNADDVERLINIGSTFAVARGEDVQASLKNLSALLSNQSLLRLDTLGISSSQVRELWNQYKSAGVESGEAFTRAFMEVAEGKLPQMAAVADSIVTPFQELQTSMTNFMDDFGNDFAYLINEMARGVRGLAAGIADIFGAGGASQGALDAQAVAGTYAGIYTGGGNPTGMLSSSNITGAIAAAILADQAGIDAGSAEFLNLLTTNAFGFSANDSLFNTDAGQQMLQQAAAIVGWYESYMAIVAGAQAGVTAPGGGPRSATARPGFASGDFSDISMGSMYSAYIMSAEKQAQQLQTLLGGASMVGGLQIISPQAAQDAENAAYALETLVSRLAGAGLEDSFLAPLQAAARASREGADAAAQWAANLENATLSQRFGQTSGGARQEMYDSVLQAMRTAGMGDDQLAALSQQFGMDSGAVTGMSAQWHNTVAPLLAEIGTQLGGEAVSIWLDAYDAAQRETMQRGYTGPLALDLISQQAGIIPLQGDFSGGGGAGDYTVKAGDTVWGLARAAGQTTTEYMAAHGLTDSMLRIGQTIPGGGSDSGRIWGWDPSEITASMDEAATSASGITDEMTTAVDTLSAGIEGVFSRTYQLPVELVISGGGVLAQLIAAAVSGAGGTTPGTSQNTGRSATGSGTRGDGTYSRGR